MQDFEPFVTLPLLRTPVTDLSQSKNEMPYILLVSAHLLSQNHSKI